jgi:AraC-like DNA-binding protein
MLTARLLAAGRDITVADVRCRPDRDTWSDLEPIRRFGVVLGRVGLLRRQVDGVESVVDATVGYVQWPGTAQRVAHPIRGSDACTSITVSTALYEWIAGCEFAVGGHRTVAVSPEVDLRHRLLLSAGRAGVDSAGVLESALTVVGDVLSHLAPTSVDAGYPASQQRRRRVVDEVRQALHVEPGFGLSELARLVGLSPYHLSRVFRHTCGVSISRYRIRLRVRRALERLADGERDLAALAHGAGFADQAHLTRAVRAETGETPGRLRTLLAPIRPAPVSPPPLLRLP